VKINASVGIGKSARDRLLARLREAVAKREAELGGAATESASNTPRLNSSQEK
jgi:hypothetical protein